ncbi:galactose-1-phosphate uridylyltransferase [Janthinobacterium agaricidamnosum]|nr:galactose-1-phosphate uridylyltransferase [Janthinobacterium agaricidamnosum]
MVIMHCKELVKPDGRQLTLYSRHAIGPVDFVPTPFAQPQGANPHVRWHPLRGEWVAYAAYRQDRTYLPSSLQTSQYNPLAVTSDPARPTELPAGEYDVAVFDNRFPALAQDAHDPPAVTVPTAPASGHCEVVVYSRDSAAFLGGLDLDHINLLLQVWAARTTRLAARGGIAYVLPFENRGAEVGVTLHHPHGQIYAYPLVPPIPLRMLEQERAFYDKHGVALLPDLAQREVGYGERLLYLGPHALAFVPPCARYPYEVWVMPLRPVDSLAALSLEQRLDLARALKTVLLKYEGLWQRPFPYLMAWFQAPTDGQPHPETQLHAEFYPPYRSRERLKYLAGTELAAGMFVMDALPEQTAQELRQVAVELEAP